MQALLDPVDLSVRLMALLIGLGCKVFLVEYLRSVLGHKTPGCF